MPFNHTRFWNVVNNYRSVCSHWREGQLLFNALFAVDKDRANEIRGSNIDTFYDDSRIERFIEYIQSLS